MGRKRLLAILAGVVAAVGLQVAPAVALDLGPVSTTAESTSVDLGPASLDVGTGDGLSVGVEAEVGDVTLDPKVTVGGSEDPLKVEGGLSVGGDGVDAGETTKPVTEPINEAIKDATGGGGDDGGNGGGSQDGTPATRDNDRSLPRDDVQAAGPDATEAPAPDRGTAPGRHLSFSVDGVDVTAGRNISPGVPGRSGFDAWSAPEVAPGITTSQPQAAPPREAALAATPIGDGTAPRDLALRLLAALLVAGAGAVWHVARKELSPTS